MSKKLTIELTVFEARQLSQAAGNIVNACDEKEQIDFFGSRVEMNAGNRALQKLDQAIYDAGKNARAAK